MLGQSIGVILQQLSSPFASQAIVVGISLNHQSYYNQGYRTELNRCTRFVVPPNKYHNTY